MTEDTKKKARPQGTETGDKTSDDAMGRVSHPGNSVNSEAADATGETTDDQTQTFLKTLTAFLPDGYQLGIFHLPAKTGQWFTAPQDAAEYVESLDHNTAEIYVHVGIAPAGFPKARAKSDDLAGRFGFVADLDMSRESAEKLLEKAGPQPTLLVHSGHGTHAWWCFDEAVIYDGDAAMYDRQEIEQISHDWIRTLRVHAADIGITEKLDGVHDLARILRVPGTTNNKEEPVLVTLISADGPRYSACDFEQFLLPDDRLGDSSEAAETDALNLKLDPEATPPQNLFLTLTQNTDSFGPTWHHNRDDIDDTSASGYDLALANIAAQAEWDPQQIANLMIAHRRHHGEDLKLRADYYERTIHKALQAAKKQQIFTETEVAPEDRPERIDQLGELLGVPLKRIEWVDGQEPLVIFTFKDGQTWETQAASLGHQYRVQDEIFARTGKRPIQQGGKSRSPEWAEMQEAIFRAAEKISTQGDASVAAEIDALIKSFIDHRFPVEQDEGDLDVYEDPFVRDGRLWVYIDKLIEHAYTFLRQKHSRSKMIQRLRGMGAVQKPFNVTVGNKRTTRSFYGLPAERYDL